MIRLFLENLERIFGWLIQASWQASVLAALVLIVQRVFRSRLNSRWTHALWLLVIARLLLPALPESALSLFQFAPSPPPVIVHSVTEPIFAPAVPAFAENLPAPSLVVAPSYPFSIWTLLALIWFVGALGLLVITWQVNRRFGRHVRHAPLIDDPVLLQIALAAQAELGLHRSLRLIESIHVQGPAIMGLIYPTLILPLNAREKFTDAELRFIFLHEFAHLKRGDLILQWLVAILQILHWFNPVLWYAFRRMRADREPATDALVLSRTGEVEQYGHVLIKLLEHYHQRHALPTLVGILEDKDQFKHRFTLIGQFTRGAYGWSLLGTLFIVILGVACLTKSKAFVTPNSSAPRAQAYLEVDYFRTADAASLPGGLETSKAEAQRRISDPKNEVVTPKVIYVALKAGPNTVTFEKPSNIRWTVTLDWQPPLAGKAQKLAVKGQWPNANGGAASYGFVQGASLRADQSFIVTGPWKTEETSNLVFSFIENPKEPKTLEANSKQLQAAVAMGQTTTVVPGPGEASDGTVAIVNGHPIKEQEIEQQSAATEQPLEHGAYAPAPAGLIHKLRQGVLDTLIDRRLILDDFKNRGGEIPPPYIDDRVNDEIKTRYGGSRDAFLRALADRHVDLDGFRQEIADNAIVQVTRTQNITAKLRRYYQDHLDLFPADEQVNITLFPIPLLPQQSGNKDQQRQAARQAVDQLRKGADIRTVTKGFASPLDLGDGWVTKDGVCSFAGHPAIWPAIENVQPGQYSDVIEDTSFYATARVNQRRPAKVPSTARTEQARNALLDAEEDRLKKEWFGSLRAQAKIQYFPPYRDVGHDTAGAAPTPTPGNPAASANADPAPSSAVGASAPLQGRILDPDGKPASNAKIGIGSSAKPLGIQLVPTGDLNISNPGLASAPTGKSGEFTLPIVPGGVTIGAFDSQGYALVPVQGFKGLIQLKPWARVAGQAFAGPTPASKFHVVLSSFPPTYDSGLGVDIQSAAITDEKGDFTIDRAPEGLVALLLLDGVPGHLPLVCHHAQTISGQLTQVLVGGKGVTVTGKVALPADRDIDSLNSIWTLPPAPDSGPRTVVTDQDKRDYMAALQTSPQLRAHEAQAQGYYFQLKPDGTFQIENVPPGPYSISIWSRRAPKRKIIDVSFAVPAGQDHYEIPSALLSADSGLPSPAASSTATTSSPHPEPMSDADAASKGIAAMVNGHPIYWWQIVYDRVDPAVVLKTKFSGDELKRMVLLDWEGMVQSHIDDELAIQEIEAEGYRIPQSDIDDRINFAIKGFGGDKQKFVDNLQRNGITLEQFEELNRHAVAFGRYYSVKISEPVARYITSHVKSPPHSPGRKAEEQALYQAESIRLTTELNTQLESHALIQRFAIPQELLASAR